MTVQLDHTIIAARDKNASAAFFAEMLGLPAPVPVGPFVAVQIDHGLSLDFSDADGDIRPQHYTFLVSDAEFGPIFERLCRRDLPYWADPRRSRPGEIAERGRSRAFYFEDPSGHFLEVLTPAAWLQDVA
jgi:catechol 2,3-dioxygenase-like lactoylglutathione lyase family enzyme